MAGWHSLSGYLQYKSGNALGRLITKRKVWCVLEESKCQLNYYKSEEDMHKQRPSQGHIDINGAAISLDLENQNQFVVLSDGKEHYFTAENHESMMIWLLGLQAKRDSYSRKITVINENDEKDDSIRDRRNSDLSMWNNRPSLFMAYPVTSQAQDDSDVPQSRRSLGQKNFRWEKYELHKWGESVDSGLSICKRRNYDTNEGVRSSSLPPVFEALEPTKSLPLQASKSVPLTCKTVSTLGLSHSAPAQHSPPGKIRNRKYVSGGQVLSVSPTTSTGSYDSDDVFDDVFKQKKQKYVSPNWRKLQSAVMSHRLPYCPPADAIREARYSSRSASSDSAIDKGESSPLELANRLSELESELISTKCELAKVMNQQTSYQELLQQKEQAIIGLERKASAAQTNGWLKKETKVSSPKLTKSDKEFQEKIRVLQNQNRFLNEEVKKLARIRLQEHNKYQDQTLRLKSLEAEIEKWKMDYVTLIQSSIRFPGQEGNEDLELTLYGGDKHKTRVKSLLDEARKINPRLPTYDSLANNEVHVDTYGFKHVYMSSGLLLHYLCTELTHHYLVQAGVYEDHQKKWTLFMRQYGKSPMKSAKELKSLCRGGIPDRFRKQMWRHLVHHHVRDVIKEKGDYYYRNLCNMLPESPLASCYRKQVSLDLMRTMPGNIKFSAAGSKGIMDLQDVLLAFCIHNPTIGYCQGMNFIVGMSLIFMDAQDAFWTLVAIAERYFSPHYFDHSLIGAQSDQQVLKDMVKDKLPDLYNHLDSIDIELSTITLNWFLAVFFDAVPFQTLLRIWDCFLLEGPKVLFRFALAILKLHEKDILQKTDTMGIMKHLKACAKLTYDVEGLVKLAFEGLKPFYKRRDISTKQTCYLNALKEKHKKKELQRLAFAEREQLYMSMEAEAGIFMGIECAVSGPDGKVWICYGDQHIGRLSCVTCEQGHMTSLEWKLDSRLMCMCAMSPDKLVMGTISWMLLAFNVTTRDQEWQIQLHDAILSVCCCDDETMTTRIFSGLADGTVAVVEQQYKRTEPNMDVLYIPIGQAPVTCLMVQGEQLWCASGNTVAILHVKSLDTLDTLSVSVNPYDHILSLVPGDYGIWVTLRGSSILELWDPKALCCRMLYDTRTDRYPQLKKEDDTYFNRARITSILANGNTVWVGTGEGNLIIYEILETSQLKTPTVMSPSVENLSSVHSGGTCKQKQDILKEVTAKDIKARLMHVGTNSRRRILEHADSLEVNINPSSPGPVEMLNSLSQNTSDDNDDVDSEERDEMKKFSAFNKLNTAKDASACHKNMVSEKGAINNTDTIDKKNENIECKSQETNRRRCTGMAVTLTPEQQKELTENYEKTSENQRSVKWQAFKRESSESCLQVSRSSVETEDLESPLEQIYEADARSSFSNQLIEAEEVERLQELSNAYLQQSTSKGVKRPLVKLRSEGSILRQQKEDEGSDTIHCPEESAFEAKMEEYARRNSSSSSLIQREDFDRIQAIYEQSLEAQTKGLRKSSKESNSEKTQKKWTNNGSFESKNSATSNSSIKLDKDDFDRLQAIYAEAVDAQKKERRKSIEKRRKISAEKIFSVNNNAIAEEAEDFEKMQTIYDAAVDNQIQSRKISITKEPCTRERRRSSSENDLSAFESTDRQNKAQRKLSDTKPFIKERRRSSSENDLLSMHSTYDSLECQGRSESMVKCSDSERNEELYEEKLEQEALRDTLGNCEFLSPATDLLSPSSCEYLYSPDSDISHGFEQNQNIMRSERFVTAKQDGGYWLTEKETDFQRDGAGEDDPFNEEIRYNGFLESHDQKVCSCQHLVHKDRSCKLVDKNSDEGESNKDYLKQNGISDELRERLLQNCHHSEANLDLKDALNILNYCKTSSQGQKEGKREPQTVLLTVNSPGKERRRHSEGYNVPDKSGVPRRGERSLSLQKGHLEGMNYNEQDLSDSITRQEKVGMWLSSISSDLERSNSDDDSVYVNIRREESCNKLKNEKNKFEGSSEDEVFCSAKETASDSCSNNQSTKHTSSIGKLKQSGFRKQGGQYIIGTEGPESESKIINSQMSSRNSSSVSEKQLNNKDSDAQYRLEFSGIHVETDQESEKENEVQCLADLTTLSKMAKLGNSDKRKSSLDLGSIQEKCSRFYETFINRIDSIKLDGDDMPLKMTDRQKLFEYLRTPSLESRHMSLGPKIAEEDLEWADVFTPQYSTHSPTSSADHRMADFLKTPSISSRPSSLWSSYENISTPTEQDNRFLSTIHHRGHLSHSASSASICTDNGILYNVDLTLEAKMKISDKPVKCLLPTSVNGEPLILSCSGSYGDDEAVLKWKKHANELLWTNEPILEFCLKTKTKILPTYMRRRLSSNSSFQSHGSEESATTYLSSSSHK